MPFNTVLDRVISHKESTMDQTQKVPVQRVPYIILFMGEFFGTAILMCIGCMGCVLEFPGGPIIPSFAFGFAVLAAFQAVGHITGCHINPAVSVGILILGKISWLQLLVYIPGQYLGGLAGYAALKAMMPSGYQICVLQLANGVTLTQGFFIEFIVTFILMLVIAGCMDTKNSIKTDSIPLRIGFAITGFVFVTAPFTSSSLNPARCLAPSVLNNHWDHHWLFHLGPYLGAMTAAFVYRYIFEENENYSLYKCIQKRK